MKFKPSTESINVKPNVYDEYFIQLPLTHEILGKKVAIAVDFQVGADGFMDPKLVDAYNKFFVKLPEVIKNSMSLILKTVPYDNADKVKIDESYLKAHFDGLTSCCVFRGQVSANGVLSPKNSVVCHCSLEWKSNDPNNYDIPLDIEHGDGFAMVDGKIVMGKPGDFY